MMRNNDGSLRATRGSGQGTAAGTFELPCFSHVRSLIPHILVAHL